LLFLVHSGEDEPASRIPSSEVPHKELCQIVGEDAPDFGSPLPHERQVGPPPVLLHVGSFKVRHLRDSESLVEEEERDEEIPPAARSPGTDRPK
jgi:hypothetical protein